MGQIDEGRGEIHSRKDAVAMAQHVLSEHLHTAGGRQKQSEQNREGGCLPGAVAAQQRRGDATRDAETDAVYCDGVRIALDEVVDFDGEFGHRPYMTRCRFLGQCRAGDAALAISRPSEEKKR